MSIVKPLSKKAINSIKNTGFLNVWEGAVRSSKTVVSELAWIKYLEETDEKVFIMSGKTNATLYKNVIAGEFGLLSILGPLADYHNDQAGNRVLEIKTNKGKKVSYCVGGNDERSYTKIRGLTAGGWYADEVNLQPRSFIEECLRRTIVSSDRKHFWTLNPDNPNHFIYTDFIDKYLEEGLNGYYLWKFYLDDNLAITEERKKELKKQFTGIFYKRYIEGIRVASEGIIYDMFDEKENTYEHDLDANLKRNSERYVAIDYGTTNPCAFLEIYDTGDEIYVDNEYYWDSKETQKQKTDSEYAQDMLAFTQDLNPIVVIDPSAESFKVALMQKGYYVKNADNDVINGIRAVSNLIQSRKLKINKNRCPMLLKEMYSYSWDDKASMKGIEKPIKQFDHACDALRYAIYTLLPSWRIGVDNNT